MDRKEYFLICYNHTAVMAYNYRTYKYIDTYRSENGKFAFLKREKIH